MYRDSSEMRPFCEQLNKVDGWRNAKNRNCSNDRWRSELRQLLVGRRNSLLRPPDARTVEPATTGKVDGLYRVYPRNAMLARVLAMARCLSVCLSVCLSQVGVLLKWLDGSSWFLAWRLLSTSPTLCCFKEIQVRTKIRVLPSGTF